MKADDVIQLHDSLKHLPSTELRVLMQRAEEAITRGAGDPDAYQLLLLCHGELAQRTWA